MVDRFSRISNNIDIRKNNGPVYHKPFVESGVIFVTDLRITVP